jgi:hypothetical protein
MSAITNIDTLNRIKSSDFKVIGKILFEFLAFEWANRDDNLLQKREELAVDLSQFLNKYLDSEVLKSDKYKLAIIDLIDKLNAQKEIFELAKQGLSESNIKLAAERLANKSQSTFSSKIANGIRK